MPTQTQKLFNRFIEQYYPELAKEMPMQDIMHDAYCTVYYYRRPYIPTPEQFRNLMHDSYRRCFLSELNHMMRYPCPDPRFWLYLEEHEDELMPTRGDAHINESRSVSDLTANDLRKLFEFVRKHFNPVAYEVFKKSIIRQMSYADIAKAEGLTRKEVKTIIDEIERFIRNNYKVKQSKENDL